MTAVLASDLERQANVPAWNLAWLTPGRCRAILALVLLLGAGLHVRYLTHHCPVDLSGDEAQYWDWSRQLDWGYYSKGPAVAFIIRASCAIFGDTMPGVRFPALAFGIGTSITAYLLTKRLFGSEKLALGAVLLNHVVPMFVAGSIVMTIDPPMFFCWAVATFFAAGAIFKQKPASWIFAGLFVGLGSLAKYGVLLWWPGLALFLLIDPASRKQFRSPALWIGVVLSLACLTPPVIWNISHNWVTLRHVATQTGATGHGHGNIGEMIGSQIGVIGPILSLMMTLGIIQTVRAFRRARSDATEPTLDAYLTGATHIGERSTPVAPHPSDGSDDFPRERLFLAVVGLFFFATNVFASFKTKVQVNWPAPAYFTLTILTAYWLSTRLASKQTWRRWRMWFWGTVALGLFVAPVAHDSSLLFPIVTRFNRTFATKLDPAKVDVLVKLRGWAMLGQTISRQLATLGDGAFVLCDDYQQTAETAFYVDAHPKTYYMGSYYSDAKRFTQYDMWPDRSLSQEKLIGKNAIYVGKGGTVPKDLSQAFERVEKLDDVPVIVRGVEVKSFKMWRGYGFKGMKRSTGGQLDF